MAGSESDANFAPSNSQWSKVQAWLLSTHMQNHASLNGSQHVAGPSARHGVISPGQTARAPATFTALSNPLQIETDVSASYDSILQHQIPIPAFPNCTKSMTSTESLTKDACSIQEDSPRGADDPNYAPGSSIRRMLSHLQRVSAGASAELQDMPSLRCLPMCPAVRASPTSEDHTRAAYVPRKLPLLSGGPLARTDAVQQQVSKLFLQQPAAGSALGRVGPDPNAPVPAGKPALQKLHTHSPSRHTSTTSMVSLATDTAPELDVSSTAGSSTLHLSSPRSVFANACEGAGDARPYNGAPKPSCDESRVAALRSLRMLDTMPEPRFDGITHLVSEVLSPPTCCPQQQYPRTLQTHPSQHFPGPSPDAEIPNRPFAVVWEFAGGCPPRLQVPAVPHPETLPSLVS